MKIYAENGKDRNKQIKFLFDFIKPHKLGVMATVTGNSLPQAAVVGIAVTKELELFCSSFTASRKYKNLRVNPRVAVVIGWDKGKTVQYEGTAEELDVDLGEEVPLRTILAGVPSIGKYIPREHRVFYKIKPTWIRFSDLSVEPWYRFELKF